MKLSIVMATYNRGHLLARSLRTYYTSQCIELEDFEIVVVDDDSTDNTRALCHEYMQMGMNIKYIHLAKPQGVAWRDCAAIINKGIRASEGQFIVLTHPEVMVGAMTLARVVAEAKDHVYVCAKIYYLTIGQQAVIDTVDWNYDLLYVQHLPNFYGQGQSAEFTGNRDYLPENIEKAPVWESWVFGGLSRKTWKEIGGMSEHSTWGTIDVTFLQRRNLLAIRNHTLQLFDTYCVHQNHDDPSVNVPTPRDMQAALANIPPMRTRDEAICHHLEGWE